MTPRDRIQNFQLRVSTLFSCCFLMLNTEQKQVSFTEIRIQKDPNEDLLCSLPCNNRYSSSRSGAWVQLLWLKLAFTPHTFCPLKLARQRAGGAVPSFEYFHLVSKLIKSGINAPNPGLCFKMQKLSRL